MARMYPPEPFNNGSNAEEDLFRLMRSDLSDEWIVLHSLGLADHPRKPWAEIDFVLIGPPGVFCLEVKGGRVGRENGWWHFTNRNNVTNSKREGPFEQVGSAAATLFNRLSGEFDWFSGIAVGYSVATPDQTWTASGPDILPDVIYDERDQLRRFSAFMRRVSNYWSDRLEQQRNGRPLHNLSDRDRQEILTSLRADFDMRPSLRSRVDSAKKDLFSLTKAQYNALDGLAENPRAIITGGAGSGKTLLAAEEARRYTGEGKRVFFCCFNRRLGSFLQEVFSDNAGVDVYHLHGFMKSIIDRAGMTRELPSAEEKDLFEVFYPQICLNALDKLDLLGSYDILIVDEAQDLLNDSFLDVLDMMLKGSLDKGMWRFFLDPFQDLFHGTSISAPQRLLRTNPTQYRLTANCRNTAPIGVAAALLSGMDCQETLTAAGPEIESETYRDAAEERRLISRCVNRFLSNGIAPSEIVILSRYKLENSGLWDGLENVPFPLIEMDGHRPPKDRKVISYATISSYKGLEADAVIVADIDDLENPDALSLIYVGATRAKVMLAYFRDRKTDNQYSERARDYGQRAAAAVRRVESAPLW